MGCAEEEWSGLRIANALGAEQGRLMVQLDGRDWNSSGLGVGEVTSLRRVRPGSHRLSFANAGLKGREVRLSLKLNECVTLVPHLVRQTTEVGMEIRVLKLEALSSPGGRMLSVVDVSPQPMRLLELRQLGESWSPVALRRMELERLPIRQHRGYLPLRVGKQRLSSMPVFDKGHHVLVLFEVGNGRLSSLCFRDRPWPLAGGQ